MATLVLTNIVAAGFGRHGMPRRPLTMTFDHLTLKLVCESHLRWGTLLPNLSTLPLGSRIIRYVRDGRTEKATLIAPVPTVCGITISRGGGIFQDYLCTSHWRDSNSARLVTTCSSSYLDFGPRRNIESLWQSVFDEVITVNVTSQCPASEVLRLQTSYRVTQKVRTLV